MYNRTTTLDDVYRHYAPHKKIKKKQDVQDDDVEEFDGDVTGYAVQANLPGKFYRPPHEGRFQKLLYKYCMMHLIFIYSMNR